MKNIFKTFTSLFNTTSVLFMAFFISVAVFLFVKMFTFGNAIGDTSIAPFFNDKMGALLVPSSFNKIILGFAKKGLTE